MTSSKETMKVTLMTLKLALEPLFFFFALEFLQNDRLNISSFCGIYFGISTITTLRMLDSGTNIFAKRHSSMNWKQSWKHNQSVTSALNSSCSNPRPFHRETEWMKEDLSDKCWGTIKEMASSYQTTRSRVKKKTAQWLLL